MTESVDDFLTRAGSILDDWTVSEDAMRWKPGSGQPEPPYLVFDDDEPTDPPALPPRRPPPMTAPRDPAELPTGREQWLYLASVVSGVALAFLCGATLPAPAGPIAFAVITLLLIGNIVRILLPRRPAHRPGDRPWRVVEHSPVFGWITLEKCRTRPGAALAALDWRRMRHPTARIMTRAEQERRNDDFDGRWNAMTYDEHTAAIDTERAILDAHRRP